MQRFGTKTPGEREDEEAERLVRPSPKWKPPRRDLRRERMEPEKDPDLDESDKDLSKNYKVIGGSIVERVLMRWARKLVKNPAGLDGAAQPPAQPKAKKPPKPRTPKTNPPKPPDNKQVKVKDKESGWVGWVTDQKLKENSGKYDLADEAQPESGGDPEQAKSNLLDAPDEASQKRTQKQIDTNARRELLHASNDSPEVQKSVEAFLDKNPDGSWKADEADFAGSALVKYFEERGGAPDGVKSLDDLRRVLGPEPGPEKKKSEPKGLLDLDPEEEEALAARQKQRKQDRAVRKELMQSAHDFPHVQENLENLLARNEDGSWSASEEEYADISGYFGPNGPPEGIKSLKDLRRIMGPDPDAQVFDEKHKPISLTFDDDDDVPVRKRTVPIQDDAAGASTDKALAESLAKKPLPGEKKKRKRKPKQPPPADAAGVTPDKASPAESPSPTAEPKPEPKADAQPDKGTVDLGNQVLDLIKSQVKGDPSPEMVKAVTDLLEGFKNEAKPKGKSKAKGPPPVPGSGDPEAQGEPDDQAPTEQEKKAPPKGKGQAPAKAKGKPGNLKNWKKEDLAKLNADGSYNLGDEDIDADVDDEPEKPKAPAPPQLEVERSLRTKGQPQRRVTEQEQTRAKSEILRTFSRDVADKMLTAKPPYHPDEISQLVSDYESASAIEPKDLDNAVRSFSGRYAEDPSQVPVPKYIEHKGKNVRVEDLPPNEQAAAIRKHQVRTVAMSLAIKSAVGKNLRANGASDELADAYSDFAFSGPPGENDKERDERAAKEAEKHFSQWATKPSAPASKEHVRSVLKQTTDPAARKMAVGYFQAQDYADAVAKYLDSGSLSERANPKQFVKALSEASAFLSKRSDRYDAKDRVVDTSAAFRQLAVDSLQKMYPDKAKQVRDLLDDADHKDYDSKFKAYERDLKKHEQRVKKEKLSPQDAKLYRPQEPQKPPRYDAKRQNPAQQGAKAKSLWQRFMGKTASRFIASRVAARYGASDVFTYPCPSAMDRRALYWGVEPYPQGSVAPYTHWAQPHGCEVGEPEYERIVAAAEGWLKTPVLSENVEGLDERTQLRAALDLALRDEHLESALHPSVYDRLLERLAGAEETVATKTARNESMSNKVVLHTEQADRTLARLDRIAAAIQENHNKWGMKFAAAKSLVNEIDKIADELERSTYGDSSLQRRQASVLGVRTAEVIQRESDEPYMDTFKNPMSPHQVAGDEPYMKAYADDQSSAVNHGRSTTKRELAP